MVNITRLFSLINFRYFLGKGRVELFTSIRENIRTSRDIDRLNLCDQFVYVEFNHNDTIVDEDQEGKISI
jgi:hypothetical protein